MSDALPTLASRSYYSNGEGAITWEGRVVGERTRFTEFLRRVVGPTLREHDALEHELRGLATTGMASDYLERLLRAAPEPLGWEVGEALAENALADDLGWQVRWPWNSRRDRRCPRASLPGTDLIGFLSDANADRLLIGEVKTSSDADVPPRVMRSREGMASQLEQSEANLGVHLCLIDWLRHRCTAPRDRTLFESAVGRYLKSSGRELILVGVLLRDTAPDERDLAKHGRDLSAKISTPTRVHLVAFYLPVGIEEWPNFCREVCP